MLYFRRLITVSTAIAYKNRFLLAKRTTKHQLTGLLQYKGERITLFKAIGFCYTVFLRFFRGLKIDPKYSAFLNTDFLDLGEFASLFASYPLFRDFSRVLGWRLQDNLPIIKAVSHKINYKKKKKNLRKRKFKVVYKYIYAERRQQVATRWLSLILKTSSIKLTAGLYKTVIPFIVKPADSRLPKIRRSVYMGLLSTR